MYKAINLEIIYLYIVINNYLNKPSKNNQRKLYDFFEGNTLFDKKVFYIVKNILENSYKLETLYDLTKKDIIHLKKFKEVLDFYIIQRLKNTTNNDTFNIPTSLEKNEITEYLKELYLFLSKTTSIENKALLTILYEYFEMFKNVEEIDFDCKFVEKEFKNYFDLLNIKPQSIAFFNKKKNIKIMQNLIPNETLENCLNLLNFKPKHFPQKQYFFIEIDKTLTSENRPELLGHEVGHFLNLNIFNFQNEIVQYLYTKNQNIDINLLHSWINEITADIIGFNLNNPQKFIEAFDNLDNREENYHYPPKKLRKALLINDKKYKCSNELEALLFANIEEIKNMLNIVKKQNKN